MAADELGTGQSPRCRAQGVRVQIDSSRGQRRRHGGRFRSRVFETATGAVSAALAIQCEINESLGTAADDRRLRFRIGIHVGDVIEKADGTIYGDGVKRRGRLEGLAEPAG
jgi:adenylate cyclase